MPRLLVATKNAHKTAEIRAILGETWRVTDLNDHRSAVSPEETGATFAENAAIKAAAASHTFPGLVIADDSGLEVDALDGAPGVYSARYAGLDATDAQNRAKLLSDLAADGARGKARSARFQCAICVARNGLTLETFSGSVEGIIINGERGVGGFGYDSLFVPTGYCETFAELSGEVKNRESHRARALAKAHQYLQSLAEP